MHYIVDRIVEKIVKEVPSGKMGTDSETMVMINGFEDLSIYERIASFLEQYYENTSISIRIKLAKKKWEKLKERSGDSSIFRSMESHGWVSDKESITYYRNLHDRDILVLMGGEDEEDTGGLKNCFTITPGKLFDELNGKYHSIFKKAFPGMDPKEYGGVVDRLFKNLFEYVPGDICRLDKLAEKWEGCFDSEREFVEAFYAILPEWGIQTQKIELPRVGRGNSNLLKNPHDFISRQKFKNLTKSQYVKYEALIEDYGSDPSGKFGKTWTDWPTQGFLDYEDFSNTLLAFIRGEKINENRERLLDVDYAIVNEILYNNVSGDKKTKKSLKDCNNVTGEPLEVFLSAVLSALTEAKAQEIRNLSTIEIEFKEAEIATGFSDNDDDEKQIAFIQAWKVICVHLNGLIPYINQCNWDYNGGGVEVICKNEGIFNLQTNDLDYGIIKSASPMNFLNKILFSVICKDEEGRIIRLVDADRRRDFRVEYCWRFKNEFSWLYDFSHIMGQNFCRNIEAYIPLCVMKDIAAVFSAKSEDEFFDVLEQCEIDFGYNIVSYVEKQVKDQKYQKFIILFQNLGKAFSVFGNKLCKEGFYSCLKENSDELANLRKAYQDLAEQICSTKFSENYRWIMDAFIHCFNIVPKSSILIDEENVSCCIVTPWHPAVLQKLQDQKNFVRGGAYRFWTDFQKSEKANQKKVDSMMDDLVHMADIQGAVDIFPSKGSSFIGVLNSFGAYSLYGSEEREVKTRIKDMIKKEAIYDDEFKSSDFTKMNANSYMICDVLDDYVKAMPDTKYNLNIVFVNPTDLQPIIAAVYHYIKNVKRLSKGDDAQVNIQLKIFIEPQNRGGRNYLGYWMDTFFGKEEGVNVKTYMNEYSSLSELKNLLNGNHDIVFLMGLLTLSEYSFISNTGKMDISSSECRFPIVYKPAPLSKSSKKRKIELSQPQFSSAFLHTQVVYYRHYSNVVLGDDRYIVVRESSFNEETKQLVDMLHEKAYWVVCVDTVMDGALFLENGKSHYSIIGYSTGKGTYGQYNLTVTARKSVLETVQTRFKERLKRLFKWDEERIREVTDRVILEASKLDGISLLSAINRNDYNINEFMAYVLTSMRERKRQSESVLRVIIHLDSYKHWFENTATEKKRPDFLMLSVVSYGEILKLKATVIECKISGERNIEEHIKKGEGQVKNGLECLKDIFDPKSDSLKRRYWYAQLYRALVYAQVTFSDETDEFSEVAGGLRDILNGTFEIEWSGEVLGYCFDMDGDKETVVNSGIPDVKIYYIPQKKIQEILSERGESLDFVSIGEEIIAPQGDEKDRKEDFERKMKRELQEIDNRRGMEVQYEKESLQEIHVTDSEENIRDEEDRILEREFQNLDSVRVLIGEDKFSHNIYWEFGNPQLANRHLLITGTSGQGKTYGVQTMLYEISKNHVSSVVFDYTEGFRADQLERKFTEKMEERIEQKIIYFTGVPINPFKRYPIEIAGIQDIEKISGVAGRVANILKHVYGFGEQQFAAIYESSRTGLEKHGDRMSMMLLKKELENCSNKAAKTVLSKMAPFFHDVEFTNEEFDWKDVLYSDSGKVTIFQLTNFVREIQVVITEFMLWDIWYYASKYGSKEKPFVVVLDEAQNLSHTLDSPSGKILTEGRKFGWSAWYATQSLRILSEDEVIRLMQSAFKMYFKPTDEEIIAMAKQLNPTDVNEWRSPLSNLKKGQCIVVGNRVRPDGTFGSARPVVTSVLSFEKRE